MAVIPMVRIDNRLIHGCVEATWVPQLKVKKLIAVDNETAADEFFSSILKASSASTDADVLSVQDMADRWNSGYYGDERIFVVVKSVDQAYDLFMKGVKYDFLQLGITLQAPGKIKIEQFYINKEEAELLLELCEKHKVDIKIQYSPQTPCLEFKDAIKGKF